MSLISRVPLDKLDLMKHNGAILNYALTKTRQFIEESVTSGYNATYLEADTLAQCLIEKEGATPACLGYKGYQHTLCISVNDVLVHGVPSDTQFENGDIVSLDCAIHKDGYFVDKCICFQIGDPDEKKYRLVQAAICALNASIELARPGRTIGDIGYETEKVARSFGFEVCKDFVGHGIGTEFHMLPVVPNFGVPGRGEIIKEGMCLAIEPMVLQWAADTYVTDDGWTAKSLDGGLTAHCEDTVFVTKDGPIIVTREEK